jgi:hypothetical protein
LAIISASVHRLQVRDDGMTRKPFAELLHRVKSVGEQQRRAGLEPVHARFDGDRSGLDRFVNRRQVQRQLDDWMLQAA